VKKYIFVTGGVCSSLGKGIAAASLGALLESRGYNVSMVKVDPYINVDAGTMSPFQHGEVYVTADGAETDLDLGNYARFTHSALSQENSITTGQVYQDVIKKEREGRYLGKCVQVVPHITDEIKRRIIKIGNKVEEGITIVEIGGTVGDIESIPFLEAVRQMIHDLGHEKALSVHLTLVPTVAGEEVKTKPTQHAVKAIREIGIQPDVLLCRAADELSPELRKKISNFTNIDFEAVISAPDINSTIYAIPLIYHMGGMDDIVLKKLGMKPKKANLAPWQKIIDSYDKAERTLKIAFVGKYIQLGDSYKSIDEALVHGGFANGFRVKLIKIDSERLEKRESPDELFKDVDGILVPGGFGQRGIDGMIKTAQYARENKIPYFGICLGMQIMVIEFAQNVLGLEGAYSTEFNPDTKNPVISLLEEQVDITEYGGTMRLGESSSHLKKGSHIASIYKSEIVVERHRHRYEVTNRYKEQLEAGGLEICGLTSDGALVEAVKWSDHPWGLAVQYHPEFTSRPIEPNPLFRDFIRACGEQKS